MNDSMFGPHAHPRLAANADADDSKRPFVCTRVSGVMVDYHWERIQWAHGSWAAPKGSGVAIAADFSVLAKYTQTTYIGHFSDAIDILIYGPEVLSQTWSTTESADGPKFLVFIVAAGIWRYDGPAG